MTLPRFPRSLRYRQASRELAPGADQAMVDWCEAIAAREDAGELRKWLGEGEGKAARYDIGRGFTLEAEISLTKGGRLAERRLLDLTPSDS